MERIKTLHPEGKRGVNIELEKYERVRAAILKATEGPVRFDRFFELVKEALPGFQGSVTWYTETVKLDLEARGVIQHDRKARMISRAG